QFLVLQAGFFGFLDFHIYCFLWFFTDAKVGIPFQGCKHFRKNLLADARSIYADNQEVTRIPFFGFLATALKPAVNHQNSVVH
ncbi:MAG: hypothetical protein J6P62_10410, partial [Bacteroidales bacterium]|nr:hypothetical protein [Bacteroidales bacterium]